MTSEQWQVLKRVFEGALELPPAERAACLDAACVGDPALRAEVESLLASHEDTDSFLATPAAVLGAPDATQPRKLAPG